MSGWQIAGFLLCVVIATGAQRLTGFALALVLLGLTSLFEIAPLPDVANVATVLALANAAIVLRGAHKSMDWAMLRSTVPGSVFGVAGGLLLLGWLSTNVTVLLRLLLGLIISVCAIVVLLRVEPLPRRSSRASFQFFGLLSGLLGGLFAASGPPLVYQFYRQPIDLDTLRDTLIAALATSSLLRLAVVLPSGQFSHGAWMIRPSRCSRHRAWSYRVYDPNICPDGAPPCFTSTSTRSTCRWSCCATPSCAACR